MIRPDRHTRRITFAYLILGFSWIIAGDVLVWITTGPAGTPFPVEQTLKGSLFVVLSAGFLYWIVGRAFAERREAEAELRFRANLVENLGVAVVATDLGGRIVSWNSGAVRLFGWTKDEALGNPLSEFIVPEGEREDADAALDSRQRGQVTGQVTEMELPVETKGGEIVPVFLSTSPIVDEEGELIGRAGASHPIESIRELQSEAESLTRRFRALIEGSTDLIAIVSESGVVEYSSPSRMRVLGQDPDEIIGQNILESDQIHPEDLPVARKHFRDLLDDPGGEINAVLRTRHADGSWRLLDVRAVNRIDDPVIQGIVINSRDITEKTELQHQLLQAQKMEAVGQLAGGVAHDFNNLITTILGTCDLLLNALDEASPEHDEVFEIQTAARRGADLTRQLLAFSRQQVLRPTPNAIGEIVVSLEKMLRRLIGEDVELNVDVDPEPRQVRVDRSQLEQVVMNLVVNARDAVEAGGRIDVDVSMIDLGPEEAEELPIGIGPGSYVQLRVRDNGSGISSEVRERMFEPFFTTKETGKGTGLGLSTVLGIVQQSGGHILVESEPGVGSTFRVFFSPAENEDEDLDDAEGSPAEGSGPEPGVSSPPEGSATPDADRILVVEDDPGVNRAIKRGLGRLGYHATTVSSGEEALSLLEAEAFDLVVSDLVMPGLGGADLARTIRLIRPGLPVIVMSGYTSDRMEREGLLDLADGFVQKPFTPRDIDQAIRSVLSRAR